MAVIKKYTKQDGTEAYMFRAYLGIPPESGKPVRTTRRGFQTLKEAKLELARLELSGLDLLIAKESQEKIYTYEDLYWSWYEEYKTTVKDSTLMKTERMFKNHILPAFGHYDITQITPIMCQEQMNVWHLKLAKAREVMNYAGTVFYYAMRLQLITINRTKLIRKPVRKQEIKEDKDLNFYDKEELKEFLAVAESLPNQRAYMFYRLLAFTGMRKGEALALKWSDINFKNKTLYINKAVSRRETGLYIQTPKTPASIRRISLDDKTLDLLKEFKKESQSKKGDLIFRNPDGKILSVAKPRKWLLHIQDTIDKQHDVPMKRITTHGFRHTHASLLFESGASIKDVQSRLGHSDVQTTMDVYTHVSKAAKEQLAERFNNFINF